MLLDALADGVADEPDPLERLPFGVVEVPVFVAFAGDKREAPRAPAADL